jgi:hypothetical protein
MSYEGHWRIAQATPGRAVSIPLPESVTDEQLEWLRANLPRSYRIVRPHEAIGTAPRVEDADQQLDVLRSLTAQITEKKIELLKMERSLSDTKVELAKLTQLLEERRKAAHSFGGALTDLLESIGGKLKL